MKVRELQIKTIDRLRNAGISDARLEAELLFEYCLDLSRVDLHLSERDLTRAEIDRFEDLLSRRLTREPLSYIIREKEFWSLPFVVTPEVLIPRPETELLIEKTLSLIENPQKFQGRLLDLGTGSGVIAIVLAIELPRAEIVTVDLSPSALQVARQNVVRHGVEDRVSLVNGDWLKAIRMGRIFDYIVSNPPYVAGRLEGALQPELAFEPAMALFSGDDGLVDLKKIVPVCRDYLTSGGYFVCEIGSDQHEAIAGLFAENDGLSLLEIMEDYAGLPRIAVGRRDG